MKRILHITGGMNRAGAETMIMNLYRAIDRNRFQFDFVYFTDEKCDFDDEIKELGGGIYRIEASNPFKRMRLLRELLQNNPQWETVHCHTLFSNAFHLYAAYKAGVKQRIAHSHNTSDQSKNKLVSKIYQGLSRKFQAKYATDFVACGIEAGKFLFPTVAKVKIIPNSIDTEKFSEIAKENKNYLRDQYQLDQNTIIILQLGRFTEQKNHFFTLEVASALKTDNIDFKLFFAGHGKLEKGVKEKAEEMALADKLIFLGLRRDVPQLLGGSDVMLMPSIHEGFPVVLVESQTAGTPALISDSIADEVDLRVGLVEFKSLENSPTSWAKRLIQFNRKQIVADKNRIAVLKTRGFDIFSNAKLLEHLYSSAE